MFPARRDQYSPCSPNHVILALKPICPLRTFSCHSYYEEALYPYVKRARTLSKNRVVLPFLSNACLLMRSGYYIVYEARIRHAGEYTLQWASRSLLESKYQNAYNFFATSSFITANNDPSRYWGFPLRCLVR